MQQQYDAFLDAQIAIVDDLFVPNTTFTPNGSLKFATPAEVQSAFAAATANKAACKDEGDPGLGRFLCTGRITANLGNSGSPDQVFKDMSETVDYFILDRTKPAANNFTDMNCSFGPTEIWPSGR